MGMQESSLQHIESITAEGFPTHLLGKRGTSGVTAL